MSYTELRKQFSRKCPQCGHAASGHTIIIEQVGQMTEDSNRRKCKAKNCECKVHDANFVRVGKNVLVRRDVVNGYLHD